MFPFRSVQHGSHWHGPCFATARSPPRPAHYRDAAEANLSGISRTCLIVRRVRGENFTSQTETSWKRWHNRKQGSATYSTGCICCFNDARVCAIPLTLDRHRMPPGPENRDSDHGERMSGPGVLNPDGQFVGPAEPMENSCWLDSNEGIRIPLPFGNEIPWTSRLRT